jgi:hypothetical protein
MFTKVVDNNEYSFGTSLSGYLYDVTYDELVKAFGEPTYPEPSGDNKVQKEWIFIDRNRNKFTIYDWKTYDLQFTLTEYSRWHVGSKVPANKFIDWCLKKLGK